MPSTPSNMTGVRNWRFTVAGSYIECLKTDFWVDYSASLNGDNVELGLTLNSAWEHMNLAQGAGLPRRVYFEERIKELKWNWVGLIGKLEIDRDTPQYKYCDNVTLLDVATEQADNNVLLEYHLSFGYPLSSTGGAQIARSFQFGANADSSKIAVSSDNLVIEHSRQDTTVFKEIFRAAPVRVPSGPGLYSMRLFGIKQHVAGATPLAKRQASELMLRQWMGLIGTEKPLTLDGSAFGLVHLAEVSPGTLDLPDALTYELKFVYGYGS